MPYQFGGQQYIRIVNPELANQLLNRAVCIVCGLHKSEHVSRHPQATCWLSVPLLTQRHTLCAMLVVILDHFRKLHNLNTLHSSVIK